MDRQQCWHSGRRRGAGLPERQGHRAPSKSLASKNPRASRERWGMISSHTQPVLKFFSQVAAAGLCQGWDTGLDGLWQKHQSLQFQVSTSGCRAACGCSDLQLKPSLCLRGFRVHKTPQGQLQPITWEKIKSQPCPLPRAPVLQRSRPAAAPGTQTHSLATFNISSAMYKLIIPPAPPHQRRKGFPNPPH